MQECLDGMMRDKIFLDSGCSESPRKVALRQQFVGPHDDEDYEEYDAFLTFHDPVLEREFQTQYNLSNIAADTINFCGMLALGTCFVFCVASKNGFNEGLILFLGCIMLTSLRLILILFYKKWYTQNRPDILKYMHVGHAVIAMLLSRTIKMPEFRSPSFLTLYLIRSPLIILMLTGCGMVIPFKVQVFSQLIACIASSPWVFMVCSRCEDPLSTHKIPTSPNFFSDVSKVVTQWLQRSTIIGAVDEVASKSNWYPIEGSQPCWVPLLFIHIFLGYVIPLAVVYCLEAYCRFSFTYQQRPGLVGKLKRMESFKGVLLLVLVVLAILGQCLWVTLLTVQNVMEAPGGVSFLKDQIRTYGENIIVSE